VATSGKGRVYGMDGSEAAGDARARVPMTVALTPEMRDLMEDARQRAGGISNVELIVRLLRFFVRHEMLWPVILGWPDRFAAPVQSLLDQLRDGGVLDATGGVTREVEGRASDIRTT
jgi:hypothetical protein